MKVKGMNGQRRIDSRQNFVRYSMIVDIQSDKKIEKIMINFTKLMYEIKNGGE